MKLRRTRHTLHAEDHIPPLLAFSIFWNDEGRWLRDPQDPSRPSRQVGRHSGSTDTDALHVSRTLVSSAMMKYLAHQLGVRSRASEEHVTLFDRQTAANLSSMKPCVEDGYLLEVVRSNREGLHLRSYSRGFTFALECSR